MDVDTMTESNRKMHNKSTLRHAKLFAERVRMARERRGWSQADLAQRLGVAASAVNHMEHGRRAPSVPILEALVAELGVPVAQLLGHDGEHEEVGAQQLIALFSRMEKRDREILVGVAELLVSLQKS
jgi:transcriptional regulator with XRE-family HTH domain